MFQNEFTYFSSFKATLSVDQKSSPDHVSRLACKSDVYRDKDVFITRHSRPRRPHWNWWQYPVLSSFIYLDGQFFVKYFSEVKILCYLYSFVQFARYASSAIKYNFWIFVSIYLFNIYISNYQLLIVYYLSLSFYLNPTFKLKLDVSPHPR